MATRARFTSASPSPVTGPAYMDNIDGHLEFLYDAAAFPLTAVAGVDTITASLDPDLDGGVLVDGMKFTFTPAGTNTGAVTLNIDGVGAFPVTDADGGPIGVGVFKATSRVLVEYSGGSFHTLSLNAGGGVTQNDVDQAIADFASGAVGSPRLQIEAINETFTAGDTTRFKDTSLKTTVAEQAVVPEFLILGSGVIRMKARHYSSDGGTASILRVKKNGTVVQSWLAGNSFGDRSVDVSVARGDIVHITHARNSGTGNSLALNGEVSTTSGRIFPQMIVPDSRWLTL